jgi:tripartite-type tricarboxylate transporter receptor subunit TctC
MNHKKATSSFNADRRVLVKRVGALPLAMFATQTFGQSFPSRPLKLIVPFPAGGPTDLVARPLAVLLSSALGQQVVVDNRGGAGGSVAADMVAKSAADGYTLLMGTVGTQAINPSLYRKLPYDPSTDFVSLGLAASSALAAVVHPTAPFKNVQELIAEARRKPGSINYASAGNGTPGHLTGHLFSKAANIQLSHVPYRGSAPAVTDLLGGQIMLMFDPVQSVLQHLKANRIQALAVSGSVRTRVLADVPTFAEAGVPNVQTAAWWGVYAPTKTPAPVARVLSAAVQSAVHSAEFQRQMEVSGVQIPTLSIETLATFHKSEAEKWGRAVRETGVTVE